MQQIYQACETDFPIDKYLIPYLQDVPFFAEISRQVRKVATRSIPTAGVQWTPTTDEIILYYNPDFFNSLTNWKIRGVLTHEFYHLVFGHLNSRRRKPPKLWNVATDLAINSIIIAHPRDSRPKDASDDDSPLPGFALIPGRFPDHPEGRPMSDEEKEGSKLAQLISTLPPMESSEFYFGKILNEVGECPDEELISSFDDHTLWDDVPEESREYVESRVKAIVEKAVRFADSDSNGWGTMPSNIRQEIRASVSQQINWRSVLRQFIGSLFRGERSTTIKRINKRYPYIHPGIKRGYVAKLLVAMDQSGSVPDEMVEDFFAELTSLTRKVSIDLTVFDTVSSEPKPWKRGTVPKIVRTKSGGTTFEASTAIFNDPKNRGRWDGMLIMTDGGAGKPSPTRKRRGWVLGPGTKLMFETDELQIFYSRERPMTGAWR